MTHLRKMMLEELKRRNYAQTTIRSYIRTIEDFAHYFRRPPDQLTPEHIREYQAYLFRERKLAASTVTQRLAALRFFYTRTIKKTWSVADTPYPKKTRHLPSILSPEEVAHLIDSSQTRFHRVVLMTLYGTGVRRAELTRLQIPDIDSRRMVIHIRGGFSSSPNTAFWIGWPQIDYDGLMRAENQDSFISPRPWPGFEHHVPARHLFDLPNRWGPRIGSNEGHVSWSAQYPCGPVGCHLRHKVFEFAVSHETHNLTLLRIPWSSLLRFVPAGFKMGLPSPNRCRFAGFSDLPRAGGRIPDGCFFAAENSPG